MSAFDHFNFLAPFYDRIIRPSISNSFLRLIDPLDGSLILDAAGGTGRIAQFLKTGLSRVIVADLSFRMLKETRIKPALSPVQSIAEHLPFPPGIFDRVIMVDALHHVFSQADTAQELWRVLKPGGRIVIEEPDISSIPGKLIAAMEKLMAMRSHFLDQQAIGSLFQSMDCRIEIEQIDHTLWVVVNKPQVLK